MMVRKIERSRSAVTGSRGSNRGTASCAADGSSCRDRANGIPAARFALAVASMGAAGSTSERSRYLQAVATSIAPCARRFADGRNFEIVRMTEEERKNRGQKSAVIVERLVRVQLRAMSCERFDIGIKRDAGEMILREGQGALEIEATIKWLRHENAKGAHIYVRPAGTHRLSL